MRWRSTEEDDLVMVAWQLGGNSVRYGGGSGGRKMGEPEQHWWRTKWAGDSAGWCGGAVDRKAGDGEEIQRWKAKKGEQLMESSIKQKLLN